MKRAQRNTVQACDACRLRKVRCNGEERCQQCSHLNLRCVYSASKTQRGPFKRGDLIRRYKTATSAHHDGAAHASPSTSGLEIESSEARGGQSHAGHDATVEESDFGNAFYAPSLQSPMGHSPPEHDPVAHDRDFFLSLLPDYGKAVYPVNPVISVAEVEYSIREMPHSQEAQAFVYAVAAITTFLTFSSVQFDTPTLKRIEHWVDRAIRSKPGLTRRLEISLRAIVTNDFIHIVLNALQHPDLAFLYIREAISQIQLMHLDKASTLADLSIAERARRERLYWDIFVHERYLTISAYRPAILQPVSDLPEHDPALPSDIQDWFTQIIRLFRMVDAEFVHHWLSSRTGSSGVTLEWIQNKLGEIDAEPAGEDAMVVNLTIMQQADLVITRHWLRTLVWQLALSNCLLTSSSAGSATSLSYPLGMSARLRSLLTRISREDIEVHGAGLQQKLFEVTDTIGNVILAVPSDAFSQYVDDFMFISDVIFSLPAFDAIQRKLLQDKRVALQNLLQH